MDREKCAKGSEARGNRVRGVAFITVASHFQASGRARLGVRFQHLGYSRWRWQTMVVVCEERRGGVIHDAHARRHMCGHGIQEDSCQHR